MSSMLDPSRVIQDLEQLGASDHHAGLIFFGGTFDPPHHGHTRLPLQILDQLADRAQGVIYVPAAQSPHKEEQPTPPNHRITMLEHHLRLIPNVWIWTHEIDQATDSSSQPSYWAHTWAHIKSARPNAKDTFLIGADQALAMHRWFEYESFWRDAIVMLRGEFESPNDLITAISDSQIWTNEELEHWRGQIFEIAPYLASSTAIRSALADSERRKNLIAGLDDRVHEYILEHQLYRS
jgi:nicotinate-nucleotide adenylyltransferase